MKTFWMTVFITLAFCLLDSELRAWNIPGHMLSGATVYQILQRESPAKIPIVRSILEKKPWYETRWKAQLTTTTAETKMSMEKIEYQSDTRTSNPRSASNR